MKRFENQIILVISLLICAIISGCLLSGSSGKESIAVVEKISIDSLAQVNDDELSKQVIDYIENHPDEYETIANYALLTRTFHNNVKIRKQSGDNAYAEVVLNSIPLLGGMIIDHSIENFLESYKKALVDKIGDNTALKNVVASYLKNGEIIQETHDIFLKQHLKESVSNETYNTMVKISALMYREMEPIIDDAKTRIGLEPDVFDLIDIAVYSTFYKEENMIKNESARKSLEAIYTKLNLDNSQSLENFWGAMVPRWLYPYRFSNQIIPSSDNGVLYDNHATESMRKKLYSLVNGKWESIITGKEENIQLNPNSDHKLYEDNKINYIDVMCKDIPYVVYNLPNGRERAFITKATYTYPYDGKSEEVLVMYKDYGFLSFNNYDRGKKYSENLRIENMKSAKDILIKRKNDNGTFEGEFDARVAFRLNGNKYYLSDRYVPASFPNFEEDFVYEMLEPFTSNKQSWDKMIHLLNGRWQSLNNSEDMNISASYSNKSTSSNYYLNYISFIGKELNYARCTISDYATKSNRKSVAIIPAIDMQTGSEVYLMYVNYKLIKYNGEDKGAKFVENITLDNIQYADNVLIKQ